MVPGKQDDVERTKSTISEATRSVPKQAGRDQTRRGMLLDGAEGASSAAAWAALSSRRSDSVGYRSPGL